MRPQSRSEYATDGAIHIIGISAAIVGVVVLIAMIAVRSGMLELVTAAIYATGLLAMLVFSAIYNMARRSRRRDLLRRFDQAAIFVMIAGTYTPFTIIELDGAWRIALTSLVWSAALSGAAIKLFLPGRLEGLSVGIYLILGWVGIVAIAPFTAALSASVLLLLLLGGTTYSIGTVFHIWRKLPYQNAIWHGCVLVAASLHYVAILDVSIAG